MDGELMLMQMKFPGNQSDAEIERSFKMQMDQMGQSTEVSVEESETRTFMIDDEEVDFLFVTGVKGQNETKVKQVQGVFPGRNGTIMLMVIEGEETWDEAEVVKMIESITVSEDGVPATNAEIPADAEPQSEPEAGEPEANAPATEEAEAETVPVEQSVED